MIHVHDIMIDSRLIWIYVTRKDTFAILNNNLRPLNWKTIRKTTWKLKGLEFLVLKKLLPIYSKWQDKTFFRSLRDERLFFSSRPMPSFYLGHSCSSLSILTVSVLTCGEAVIPIYHWHEGLRLCMPWHPGCSGCSGWVVNVTRLLWTNSLVLSYSWSSTRAGLKYHSQVARIFQASLDKSGKQQQEQNSPNLGRVI